MMAELKKSNASVSWIGERCKMLQYAGMVATVHDEMHKLTMNGELSLSEEIDARYRPWPTVDRVLRG